MEILLATTPQGNRHATSVDLVADSLRHAFRTGFRVRTWLWAAPINQEEPK